MNKLILCLFFSLLSVSSMAAPILTGAGELVVVKKEPVLDNGSTNPPPKPPAGSSEKPLK